jgi:predicted nucleotidyltransferase
LSSDEVLSLLHFNAPKLRSLGVRSIALFGSVVRGEADESSDLDFLIDLERKTFDAYMDVKFYLEELFGRRVDLVLTDTIKQQLREAVLREAVHAAGF